MEQTAQENVLETGRDEGNTKSSSPQKDNKKKNRSEQQNQLQCWCLTIWKDFGDDGDDRDKIYRTYNPIDIWNMFNEQCSEFYFQLEKTKDNLLHYQCVIKLHRNNRLRFAQVKNNFGDTTHIEPCKNWHASKMYCQKLDSRVQGPWSHAQKPLRCINVFREWQNQVIKSIDQEIETPNDRIINWIYDPDGNNGKSSLIRWLLINRPGSQMLENGKKSDLAHAIKTDTNLILFALQRDQNEIFNYSALESLKDGMIFSGKYDSCSKLFDPPCIWVFSNWYPDRTRLTEDRWRIYAIYSNKLKKYIDPEFDHEDYIEQQNTLWNFRSQKK